MTLIYCKYNLYYNIIMKSFAILMLLYSTCIHNGQAVKLNYPGVRMLPNSNQEVRFAQMKNKASKWDESLTNVVNDKEYMSEEADVLSEHKIDNPS